MGTRLAREAREWAPALRSMFGASARAQSLVLREIADVALDDERGTDELPARLYFAGHEPLAQAAAFYDPWNEVCPASALRKTRACIQALVAQGAIELVERPGVARRTAVYRFNKRPGAPDVFGPRGG